MASNGGLSPAAIKFYAGVSVGREDTLTTVGAPRLGETPDNSARPTQPSKTVMLDGPHGGKKPQS